MSDLPYRARLIRHYALYWGEAVNPSEFLFEIDSKVGRIQVYKFRPESTEQDWVYATVGASMEEMHVPNDMVALFATRFELFVYSRHEVDALADAIAKMAIYPFVHKTYFDVGHTVMGTHGVIPDSHLTDFLILPSLFENSQLRLIHLDDDTHVRILWAIPVTRSEREYASSQGWRALVKAFDDNETDTSDFFRDSLI